MNEDEAEEVNSENYWYPKTFNKAQNLVREIDDLKELITTHPFGSYRYMLKTNNVVLSQIQAHCDIKPTYKVKTLKEYLGDFVPKKILDIGCGLGFTTNELKKSYPDAQVTGIDIITDGILFAKENFKCCDFLSEPIDPNNEDRVHKADLICAFEFYPFTRTPKIKDHRKYLDHLLGWLNEGGCLVIYQRWDTDHGLSMNYKELVDEYTDWTFQSFPMPIGIIGRTIKNKKIAILLSFFLRPILRKLTGKEMGEIKLNIISKLY